MIRRDKGFTLVELMVAMALTGITMVAVYKTFSAQEKVYSVQDDSASLRQDLRVAIELMSKDLRWAGYTAELGPKKEDSIARVVTADASTFTFTANLNTDDVVPDVTDDGEQVTYFLTGGSAPYRLTRAVLVGGLPQYQPVADNIDALNFVYVLSDGTTTSFPVDLTKIRSIQVTVVARANRADKEYVNRTCYWNQAGPQPAPPAVPDCSLSLLGAPPNDGFRRRVLTATIRCPNL